MRFLKVICVVLSVLFFPSCIQDRCSSTVCSNGGVCVDGNCSCLNGYEGAHCEKVWNERFLGNWNSVDVIKGDESGYRLKYTISISPNGRADQFVINNLANGINGVLCRRKSHYEFVIAEEQRPDSVITIKSGNGVLDSFGQKVTATYTMQIGNTTGTYNLTWTR